MRNALISVAVAGGLAAGALAVTAAPAYAGSVHVVAPGDSIQDAVDAAAPGDTIKLMAGTYDGGILVTKDRIRIRGDGYATVLRPGATNHCENSAEESGICVIGTEGHPVHGVTVERLTVRDFEAFGVVGFATDKLTVERIKAVDNGEYGITEFGSTRGRFAYNWVAGSSLEAGLYVGDIADAEGTMLIGNHVESSALGALVRHAHDVKLINNTFVDNCTGIALVDDGQAGGMGHNRVVNNTVTDNNRFCPPHEEVPPLQGAGIVLIGGQHNSVIANHVLRNVGTGGVPFNGGIILVPGLPPTNTPGSDNSIIANKLDGNEPADIIDVNGGTDKIVGNRCDTSLPSGLC